MGEVRMTVPRLRKIAGRFYWWPTPAVQRLGFRSEALGRDAGAAAARARELNEQVERERQGLRPPAAEPETVAALIRLYESDAAFRNRRATTRRVYQNVLRQIEKNEGQVPVKSITTRQLKAVYRELLTRGVAVAALHMRVWRVLLKFAVGEDWITVNPGQDFTIEAAPARELVWTWAQIDAFCRAADAEGAPSMALAVMLAYDLAQRQGDVLALTWASRKPGGWLVRQSKTAAAVLVPLRWPETRRRLAKVERGDSVQVVICETTGKAYRPDHFRHEFARIRKLAGLPGALQFRDLRRTAATEIGDGGASSQQIRSVTGHASDAMLKVYVQPTGTQAAAAQKGRRRTKRQSK
jgi:integrase